MQTDPIQIPVEVIESNAAALKEIQAKLGGIRTTVAEMAEQQKTLGQQFKQSWTEINSAIGVAKQAYRLLKSAVDETVGVFVTYAGQVREISQVTGQQAEEVSRLIQVTDDYKIRTESLNTVMRKMATEEMPLTIESLAQLSDEYLQLGSGVERQIFLTEKFGRQGVDFAEIMLAGGAAIRAKSAAIQDGLILDQKALDQARDYEIKLDDLTDSVNALKIAAGKEAIPIVIELIMKVTTAIGVAQSLPEMGRQFKDLRNEMAVGSATYEEYAKKHFAFIQGLSTSEKIILGLTTDTGLLTEEYYEHIKAIRVLDEANQRIDGSFSEATIAAAKMAEGLNGVSGAAALTAEELENIRKLLVDQTGWETMYTGAKDAAEQSKQTFDLLGGWLQNLSADGAAIWEGLLVATGKISPAAIEQFLLIQSAFLRMKELLGQGFTIPFIVEEIQAEYGQIFGAGAAPPSGEEWFRPGGWGQYGHPDEQWWNPITDEYRAAGGSFSGWAMVGDAPGGRTTPYTEWVYAPHGAMVYNQAQMAGQSAPPMAAGGIIPPVTTIKRQINLYDDAQFIICVENGQTIDEVVDEVLDKMR